MWLKKCLVISLLMIFVSTSNAQFTTEELQKIDLKLRNYTILSQQNILLQQKISVLEWKCNQFQDIIETQNSWWERNKFYVGFGCGIVFAFGVTYLAIWGLENIK